MGWYKRTDSCKEQFEGTFRRTANAPKNGSDKRKIGREEQFKKKRTTKTSTLEMKVLEVFSVELMREISEVKPECATAKNDQV